MSGLDLAVWHLRGGGDVAVLPHRSSDGCVKTVEGIFVGWCPGPDGGLLLISVVYDRLLMTSGPALWNVRLLLMCGY